MAVSPADRNADADVEAIRRGAHSDAVPPGDQAHFNVVVSVLCDLRLQGWSFQAEESAIQLVRPVTLLAPDLERHRIRKMHAVNRDTQLLKQSVRDFVRGIERKRIGPDGWVSIFSLMRDGRELSEKLRESQRLISDVERMPFLRTVIRPYLQLVRGGEACRYTGLLLGDIWRYFRHTWASEYQTVPGRNLMLLVRDAAAAHHPIIGIAALTSPVVHLTLRDEWIGWAPHQFVSELRANPTAAWAKWCVESLDGLIADIYINDLIESKIISTADIGSPSEDAIASLEEEAAKARKKHQLHPTKAVHKTPAKNTSDAEWQQRAQTHLFRSKRCATLAALLRARLRLKDAGFTKPTKSQLAKVLATSEGRQAVETIRKHVKAIHIGNDVLDISVCGAVAPYSDILGGKLVAMMLTSPEVVRLYTRRYGQSSSIIASSMAGRRIRRRPRLCTLTTTSLYGAQLNQYTRLRVPAAEFDGRQGNEVTFKKLGLTRGQGSFHFSAITVDLIEALLSQLAHNRSVNSIFGEGVSPRLRKIRSGLDECGFPADEVLTHGSPRVLYGIALTSNQREFLLGQAKQPKYLLPQQAAEQVSDGIAEFWLRRWLVSRIQRPDILERVERHTLVSPIVHGARVPLPRLYDDEPLFFHQSN